MVISLRALERGPAERGVDDPQLPAVKIELAQQRLDRHRVVSR
jgi:hypothetical protein